MDSALAATFGEPINKPIVTDVDASAGPHIVVRGSHGKKKLRHILSLSRVRSEGEMLKTYGAENLQTICGPSGSGFIEDPFCFHMGQEPTGRDRLVFQLRYALHDYGMGSDSVHREWMAVDWASAGSQSGLPPVAPLA
jgi:hypothetical protein